MKGMFYSRYAATILVVGICLGCAWSCPASIWGGNRDDRLGDEAVAAGDYSMAVKFYQRWVDAAEDAQDRRDASVKLAGACIRAGMIDRAAKVIDGLRRLPPAGGSNYSMALLDAELLLANGKAADVRARMEKLLQSKDLTDEFRLPALELLGRSLMMLKEWNEAVKVFALLERSGVGTRWEYLGFCKRVYALIMDGQAKEAARLLTLNIKSATREEQFEAKVLSLLLLVKEKQLKEFRDGCRQLRQGMPARPDPLMFQVMMEAADNYLALKDFDNGIFCLDEAVIFAPNPTARNQAFRLLISSTLAGGKVERMLKAAETYLSYNRGGPDDSAITMEVAALFAGQKKINTAIKLYFGLMDDHTRPLSLRLDAARAAGNLLASEKRFDEAERAFEFICRNAIDNTRQAEGYMSLGKVFFEQEFYLRAIEVFTRVSELCRPMRGDAAYWTMRSYLSLKEYRRALEWLDKIKMIEPRPDWLTAETLYYAGIIAEKSGQAETACDTLVRYATAYPDAEHAAEALFRAGNIAMNAKKYTAAAKTFQLFAEKYPRHQSAPAAQYRRLEALFLSGAAESAVAVAVTLQKKYADSRYAAAAMFWLVDYYRDNGKYQKAQEVLEWLIGKYPDNQDILAEALRDMAVIALRGGDDVRARDALTRLTRNLAQSRFTAEGYYLLGDMDSERGDYDSASDNYAKVFKFKPGKELQWAVRGRLADCNYSMHARTGDEKYQQVAMEEYRRLLKEKELPTAIREQSLFKLGKCYEQHKDWAQALELYKEVVYDYGREIEAGKARRNPVWVVNAAQAAIEIYLAMNKPESAMAAINLYRALERMRIDTGENFTSRIEAIRRRYNMK